MRDQREEFEHREGGREDEGRGVLVWRVLPVMGGGCEGVRLWSGEESVRRCGFVKKGSIVGSVICEDVKVEEGREYGECVQLVRVVVRECVQLVMVVGREKKGFLRPGAPVQGRGTWCECLSHCTQPSPRVWRTSLHSPLSPSSPVGWGGAHSGHQQQVLCHSTEPE